jgi:hypothetical protein
MDSVELNDQGGVLPRTADERKRAKAVDLGTLPSSIAGTNCGNCSFFDGHIDGVGYCKNRAVRQYVTVRMCCAAWDNPGYLRS